MAHSCASNYTGNDSLLCEHSLTKTLRRGLTRVQTLFDEHCLAGRIKSRDGEVSPQIFIRRLVSRAPALLLGLKGVPLLWGYVLGITWSYAGGQRAEFRAYGPSWVYEFIRFGSMSPLMPHLQSPLIFIRLSMKMTHDKLLNLLF